VWAALPVVVVPLLTGELLDGVVASLYAEVCICGLCYSKAEG